MACGEIGRGGWRDPLGHALGRGRSETARPWTGTRRWRSRGSRTAPRTCVWRRGAAARSWIPERSAVGGRCRWRGTQLARSHDAPGAEPGRDPAPRHTRARMRPHRLGRLGVLGRRRPHPSQGTKAMNMSTCSTPNALAVPVALIAAFVALSGCGQGPVGSCQTRDLGGGEVE
jgi:hypothetical protein